MKMMLISSNSYINKKINEYNMLLIIAICDLGRTLSTLLAQAQTEWDAQMSLHAVYGAVFLRRFYPTRDTF